MSTLKKNWSLYLIRTSTNSLYCGVTTDLQRRFQQHKVGKGAKALRGKGPLSLVWSQSGLTKIESMRLEYALKQLTKAKKEAIVTSNKTLDLVEGYITAFD